MSGGIQITIPDLDDAELGPASTPFGRAGAHAFGFGAMGGGSGSGQDSPTIMTPNADRGERNYFPSHSRVDSAASEDSVQSVTTRYNTTKSTTHFGHSSSSSIATGSTAFTKKPSFASIRNAFKKTIDPPPVPHLDHQPYPILKNPFNRSTSSLNHISPVTARGPGSPFPRPPTPGSNEKHGRGTPSKSKSHGKSHHSQSGSIFQASEIASEYGFGHVYSSSPPPVPRVPNAFGLVQRSETPPGMDLDDDKVVMDPKTPSDYALHAVFIQFATSAEGKIETFLHQPLESDILLSTVMGPDIDPKFDETLQSLGKIAQKHMMPVIDSIRRWRRSQNENVGSEIIRYTPRNPRDLAEPFEHMISQGFSTNGNLSLRYILCAYMSKDGLGEAIGLNLEETTFEQFRRPDLKLLAQSANHRTNAELYATLLGHIANVRFVSVTDRFLAELGPIAQGQVPKDLDMKYENLIKGLKHIQIKVWPPEAFEEGAEFLESLSKSFSHAHGLRLKTAQAETNNPQWAKAIELIYPKAREMMSKPRYWPVAFPLAITSLCVAPQAYFLKHLTNCLEISLSKLKEKQYRTQAMNGIIRLTWAYLYRCQESASTTTTRLDGLLKHFFPPNRHHVYPPEDHLEPFIYITHFVLSRHWDYGRDLCMELIQESSINASQQSGNLVNAIAADRTAVAIRAILLSLYGMEKENITPAWPSSSDFSVIPSRDDYPSSSESLPIALSSKPTILEFFDRCGTILGIIATFCASSVGRISIFDEQWSSTRLNLAYDESHVYVFRRHPDGGTFAYPQHLIPQVNLLQTSFQSWPRCLHPSVPFEDAIDMLLRGVIHVEPLLRDEASGALKRIMSNQTHAPMVLSKFYDFLFSHSSIMHEITGVKLLIESQLLLNLWVDVAETWIRDLIQDNFQWPLDEADPIPSRITELEAAALFLLSHEAQAIHSAGIKIVRVLGLLVSHISPQSSPTPMVFVENLHGKGVDQDYLSGYDEVLDKPDLARLEQWRESKHSDIPLRLADSTNEKDRKLWRYLFPKFLQVCMGNSSPTLSRFRRSVVAAVSRLHPTISHLAGLSSRAPPHLASRNFSNFERDGPKLIRENKPLIDQWHLWVKILCSTATLSESSRPPLTQLGREHGRAPSESSFERERLSTTRGLFRHLTPFLDSEYTLFRDAAVLCISSFPSSAYSQLLEDLSLLAGRQFYDDPRSKLIVNIDDPRLKMAPLGLPDRTRRQERLHSAVARIYYLTAHLLQHQRSAGRQAALANVLKFVRNTQAFLTAPEMRDNHTLQRLRRYFCGTVERLFDGLAALKDSDRFIPPNMHLTLYRLCEEWCQFGSQPDSVKQRFNLMKKSASSANPQVEPSIALERFLHETQLLSYAAVGALASLCQRAIFPPDMSSNSPTEGLPIEYLKPISPASLLERLNAILSSDHAPTQTRGKKALRSVLTDNQDVTLIDESLRRAVVLSEGLDSNSGRFFDAIVDIICNSKYHNFQFAQVVCLGLSNLRHPLVETRRLAFNMLEAIHQQSSGLLSMSNFEAAVGSLAPSTYTHAHRLISDFLAGEHPHQAANILAWLSSWLSHLPETASSTNITLLLLQSLEFWIPNIELMTEDKSGLSHEGLSALYHLVSLTLRHDQTHAEQILVMWSKLVEPPHESNGHATVRFLLEQSHKVGRMIYINCAAHIVACLCQTHIGHDIFEDLCSVIEPARMLPTIEHKLAFPDAHDMELWSDLDTLFADQPRLSLGSAQFAWLFMADVALQRCWELRPQLPILLHALFTHLDHRTEFVRSRAQAMLFQLLRSWAPGYDELPDRSTYPGYWVLKEQLTRLEEEAKAMYWRDDETGIDLEPKMAWLCMRIIPYLEPLSPALTDRWGSLALNWGTSCSIRATAFRSLQIFRALMPRVKKSDLALLLGRLSNTIAAAEDNIQTFTSEIILTITAVATSADVDRSLLPQLFWCTCACLSTTVEKEFEQILTLLESLLHKIDLGDPSTVDFLMSQRPLDWSGPVSLQPTLLKGLRSSRTSKATMKILQSLTKVEDSRLIDDTDGRVRDLYTLSLPWCLQAMSVEPSDDTLKDFAENVGILASTKADKDDFLRQSVASLREHYGHDHWTEIVTLLLGLVLNQERWLRIQAMQILKVLFQHRETRNPVELLGSELLMPLLRLLETDLASHALEVLEEPMTMSGGPAAKHVLRMSMHARTLPKEVDSTITVFGVPDMSGWCVGQPDKLRDICRSNVMAVFDTCSMPSRPSRIDFEPELESLAIEKKPSQEDLGGLVKDLHELTSFFQDDGPSPSSKSSFTLPPSKRLEARVAAILAKSTATDSSTGVPQTPFLDVFRVGGPLASDESDEDSEIESEDDFIFDSHTNYRSAPNGSRVH
ncbi:cell morphogenesis N-terminal-domain-containing protein [Infundibulicybe gibba]|nr:cell morphogenesis N-terminal-domain-containing protein [Infundibulicybe gibba]